MAKLSTAERAKIPGKEFAGPDRSYPINDPAHARAALMLINKGSLDSAQKAHVRTMAHAMLSGGMKK